MYSRSELILEIVQKQLDEGKNVIIIDDELNLKKPDTKIITNPEIKVYYFNNFLQENYQIIEKDLERLSQQINPCVVHTDITGNRGVDFKFRQG